MDRVLPADSRGMVGPFHEHLLSLLLWKGTQKKQTNCSNLMVKAASIYGRDYYYHTGIHMPPLFFSSILSFKQ